jgi:hypothetical protein
MATGTIPDWLLDVARMLAKGTLEDGDLMVIKSPTGNSGGAMFTGVLPDGTGITLGPAKPTYNRQGTSFRVRLTRG